MSNSFVPDVLTPLEAPEFDLALTLNSGQAFHWTKAGEGFAGTIANIPVYAEQHGASLRVTPGTESLARHYFALDHSPSEIHASFPDDPAMNASLEFCRGMRILRQPAWECLATFITSSMKQVAHIRQMSLAIRAKFGRRVRLQGAELFTYPSTNRLAKASEEELRECKLGFRAKNLLGTARMIAEGAVELERIKTMSDTDALAELCKLPGVGEKVANCVLLFAFERLKAFPIDVWIERVLRETYFKRKRNLTQKHLRDFSQTYFGEYGGYAQQYLFHYARMRKNESGNHEIRKNM
ncbi:MAG: DNA glycosylase [Verrucomicrobiota bacterium]